MTAGENMTICLREMRVTPNTRFAPMSLRRVITESIKSEFYYSFTAALVFYGEKVLLSRQDFLLLQCFLSVQFILDFSKFTVLLQDNAKNNITLYIE